MPRKSQHTVKELRALAKAAYDRGQGNQALKGYHKMAKADLESKLGISRVTATSVSISKTGKPTLSAKRYESGKQSKAIALALKKKLGLDDVSLNKVQETLHDHIQSAISRYKKQKKNASDTELRAVGIKAIRKTIAVLKADRQAPPEKPELIRRLPSGIAEVPVHSLVADPNRFQYKIVHGKEGASGSLTGVNKWDHNLAGIIQVWHDPKDGKTYVVNGHNRAELAKRLGAKDVVVRYLDVKTPQEARSVGALTNIAEGRGTAMDAAKFFRDTKLTHKDLQDKGIPMKEKIATDGIALANLSDPLFHRVIQGDIPQERAVIIGERVKDHEAQSKLVDLIDQQAKRGRKITNDVVSELADMVQNAPTHHEQQMTLFGAEDNSRNLALEKAEVLADIRRKLSREKKLFGLVSKSKAAKDLERGGNVIDVKQSKDIHEQANQVLSVFDHLKNQSGPVSSIVNQAVERIANGEDQRKVKDETHRRLVEELPKALGLSKRKSA